MPSSEAPGIPVPMASLGELAEAMDAGSLTSVELVAAYLDRIAFYDRATVGLNAVPVLDPAVFAEAQRADRLRREGVRLGPLHGIPFVVKDSYAVRGMTLASGSPAFQDLVASADSATVALLREAGAIVLGRTTMPPMAAGGMQRGVYGRPVSPYNPDCLPAGWLSGSSSGSGVAVAAGLCAFALAEETLSSGRSPASNNALVAYVPSRGLISLRGNWPLMALRDQPVPYARSVDDLFRLLDVLVRDDDAEAVTAFDLWRDQDVVALPRPSEVRPESFMELRDPAALEGLTVGVPRMFVGRDPAVAEPFVLTPAVQRLWARAEEDLRALGATVVEVDLPAFRRFGDITEALAPQEWVGLIASTWDAFLRANGDPAMPSLAALRDFSSIFPEELHGPLGPDVNPMGRYDYAGMAAETARGITPVWEIDGLADAIRALERARREHFDAPMREQGLDLIAFPAHTGSAPATADRDPDAARLAWRPGVSYALGGPAMRALGLPGVVVPMGLMEDTGMPVGITFAGPAYADCAVLSAAFAYEHATRRRADPPHAPVAPHERLHLRGEPAPRGAVDDAPGDLRVEVAGYDGAVLRVAVEVPGGAAPRNLRVTVDGVRIDGVQAVAGRQELAVARASRGLRTTADGPQAGLVVAVAELESGARLGAFTEFDKPTRYEAPADG